MCVCLGGVTSVSTDSFLDTSLLAQLELAVLYAEERLGVAAEVRFRCWSLFG